MEAGLSLKTPELGTRYLTAIFDKLAADLLDHPFMMMRDAYYCLLPTSSTSETSATVTPPDGKKEANARPCVDYLSHLLSAVNNDGRPYTRKFGRDCTFQHLTIEDKSKQCLLDIVDSLTATASADLTRAVV